MASEAQINANRRNAQRSTGPTTPEGKAAAAQNALKHGLFARRVLGDKDDPRLQLYRDQLTAEFQPQSFNESFLVEQMAVAAFKRVLFEEVEFSLEPHLSGGLNVLEHVWRRQAQLDRVYHKSLNELRKLRQPSAPPKPAPQAEQPKPKIVPQSTPASAPFVPEPQPAGPFHYVMAAGPAEFERT